MDVAHCPGESKVGGVTLAAYSPEIGQVPRHVLHKKEVGYLLTRGGQDFSDPVLHLLVWKGEVLHGQAAASV